ncbi:hypothetical protein GUITHDRAFT_117754 [Guillardia theta CCMP2712]|uniref:Prolyl 4-hydroxylase alpha subunit domain-containing protein n=1 Tax=Guillardia theta (strain CCMP2712) TaxID=905079 RepID=L1IIM7_GUITC|nr:hypothetical protein GUITHDRAFT_117754 [Guillardia theta CCMP2712]EKX36086.1 hypothetical protein GUITHDRAFT_117754 [Guillardia theta CCMP2712]|eukprot:XP_005823066.1 hypothetical protein GUITHDRAFT_117754 [Guillardia theta CCMP2712]
MSERYQAIIGKHFTPVNCSLASRDPVELANFAADVLYPSGRLSEALFCLDAAALLLKSLQPAAAPSLAAISKNLDTMVQVLRPGERNRVYHNVGKKGATFPDHMSREHVAGTEDQTIQVWDGALSSHQCEKIIEMFERSDHYEGNLISEGKIIVDHKVKKASEYEVSEGARKSSEWAEIEQMLLSVFVNHTILYEEKNPILRQLKNPFGDEGFRMKRYLDDGTEHHAYHADSGQEAPCAPRRVVAFLVYFNGVEGGETVFLQQGRIVSPKCGRVHAGRPPTKGWKYNAINFLTIQ